MRITQLLLQNFRCFDSLKITLDESLVVIEGSNGSGKSSIIEALYYGCYLKSFRTSRLSDVARHGEESSFFVKIEGILSDGDMYTIQIGFEDGAKKIKVNDAVIATYKELMDYYRVVALSEYDLDIIQEGPEERRSFINQFCMLQDQTIVDALRLQKHIVSQRAQLFMINQGWSDHCMLWSQQLWDNSAIIRRKRQEGLALLENEIKQLVAEFSLLMPEVGLGYKAKGNSDAEDFGSFWQSHKESLLEQEIMQRRTLFGAHLDDIIITWGGKNARLYASRGQQKLIILLLKCAMVRVIQRQACLAGGTVLFLIDDFITDFDKQVMDAVTAMIQSLGCNVIVTCPLYDIVQFTRPAHIIRL